MKVQFRVVKIAILNHMKKQEREFCVFEKEKCLKLNILITPKQDLVYTEEHIGTFHWRSTTR